MGMRIRGGRGAEGCPSRVRHVVVSRPGPGRGPFRPPSSRSATNLAASST